MITNNSRLYNSGRVSPLPNYKHTRLAWIMTPGSIQSRWHQKKQTKLITEQQQSHGAVRDNIYMTVEKCCCKQELREIMYPAK